MLAQAEVLRLLGATPVIFGIADAAHGDARWRLKGYEVHALSPSGPRQFGYCRNMIAALDRARLDLLHLHGIWQYPSHAAGVWARRSGRPLVISPHGMLAPWITQSRVWKKRLARVAWERRSWRSAAAFHALTNREALDIQLEAADACIATIPNPAPTATSPRDRLPPPNALYLGRIHEKKNVAALIEAWAHARPDLPEGASLTIAGWGDDIGVEELERQLRHRPAGIEFVGTAFGSQKAALFDISRFCILPSLSEGLPIVMLESWAAGTPTMMSGECNLPEGFSSGAAIDCGVDVGTIRQALIHGFSLDEQGWLAMSRSARSLAQGSFHLSHVADRWRALYSDLIDNA